MHSNLAAFSGIRVRSKDEEKAGLNEDLTGNLEVYYNNSWAAVCFSSWDMNAAKVACRHLGLPVVKSFTHAPAVPDAHVKFWLTSVSCNGSEQILSECKNAVWKTNPCSGGKEVKLHCSFG